MINKEDILNPDYVLVVRHIAGSRAQLIFDGKTQQVQLLGIGEKFMNWPQDPRVAGGSTGANIQEIGIPFFDY